jgi:hypothetical protein
MNGHYRSMAVVWSELLSGLRNLVADTPIVRQDNACDRAV